MSENEVEKTSLPPNYLSLTQLQQRWLKQKQQDEEEKELKRIQQRKEAEQQRYHQEQQNHFRRFTEDVKKSRKGQKVDIHMQRKPVESRNGYHQLKAKAREEDDLEKEGTSSGVLGRNIVENEGYDGKFQGNGNDCAGENVSALVLNGKVGFRGPSKRNGGDQRSKVEEAEELERMGEGLEGENMGRDVGFAIGDEEKGENRERGRWGRRGPSKRNSGDQRSKVGETEESERMGEGLEEEKGRNTGSAIWSEEKGEKRERGRRGCRGPSKRNSGDQRSKVGETEESERMGEGSEGEKGRNVGSAIGIEEKSEKRERGRRRRRGPSKRNNGHQRSKVGDAKELARMGEGLKGETKDRGEGLGIGNEEKNENRERGRQGYKGSLKRNCGEKRPNVGETKELVRIGEGLEGQNKGRVLGSAIGNEEKGKNRERDRKGSRGPSKRNDGDQESNVGEDELERMGEGFKGEKKGRVVGLGIGNEEKGRVVGSGIGNEEKGKNQGMGRKVCVGYRFRGNWVKQGKKGIMVRVDFRTEVYKKNEGAEGTQVVVSDITGEKKLCEGGLQEIEEDRTVNGDAPVSLMEGSRLENSEEKLGAVKEIAETGIMASERNIARLRSKGGYQWNSNKNVSGEKTEKGFEELPLNDERTVKASRRPRTNGGYQGNRSNHMYCNNQMRKRIDSGLMWVKKGGDI